MINIERLCSEDYRSIKTVANMMYEWWGKESYISLELMEKIIKSYCKNETFPVVLIAKIDHEVVGTVSLLANDTQLRQDLFPIISSLFVKENYRNQNIGSLLMEKLIDISKKNLDFDKLYLVTNIEGYYERFGFKYLESTDTFIDLSSNKIINDRLYVLHLNEKR